MTTSKKFFIPVGFTKSSRQNNREKLKSELTSLGWTVTSSFDGGLFKSSYFIAERDSSLPDIPLPSSFRWWQKALPIVLGIWIIAAMFTSHSNNPKPTKTDQELFTEYYRLLMSKTGEADLIFEPFARALKDNDLIGATQVALKIKQPISSLWGEISQIETPDLTNQEAHSKLDQAKETISNAYLYKSIMVKDFIDFAESQNVKKLAGLKTTAENIQTLTLGGTAYLIESGSMLGVKLADLN